MRFIVIGCGRMGAGLARTLDLQGHAVTVVDGDAGAVERLGLTFRGQTLVGSGFDRDLLVEAGINHADGLAAVTNSDETNLVVARVARAVFRVPKAVARLVDPRRMSLYQRLGVQTVAPIPWAIHRFAELLSYSELDAVLSLGSGQVEIVDVDVPAMLVGRKVSTIAVPGEIQVIAVTRFGNTFIPSSETQIQKADGLHIAVLTTSVERLRTILAVT